MNKQIILFDFLTEKEMENVSGSTDSGEDPGCDPACEYYGSNSCEYLIASDEAGKPVKYICAISKTISR